MTGVWWWNRLPIFYWDRQVLCLLVMNLRVVVTPALFAPLVVVPWLPSRGFRSNPWALRRFVTLPFAFVTNNVGLRPANNSWRLLLLRLLELRLLGLLMLLLLLLQFLLLLLQNFCMLLLEFAAIPNEVAVELAMGAVPFCDLIR